MSVRPQLANMSQILGQLIDLVIVAYSLAVMASVLPTFQRFSSIELVPYYLLVPGYVITKLLSDSQRLIEKVFYSIAWSLAIAASVSSLESIAPRAQNIPISFVVPLLTLAIFAYNRFHGRFS